MAALHVIGVADAAQVDLVPVVGTVGVQIAFVVVLDLVAKWVFGSGKHPGIDLAPVIGIGRHRRIVLPSRFGAV